MKKASKIERMDADELRKHVESQYRTSPIEEAARFFGLDELQTKQLEQMHAKARQCGQPMGQADFLKYVEESVRDGLRSMELALSPMPSGPMLASVKQMIEDADKKAKRK